MAQSGHEVTRLLAVAGGGDGDGHATEALLSLVYEELRRLAQVRMAQERPGHTLQATALVHEAYLRLVGDESLRWDSRGHFFAAAAEAMRRILVERARDGGRTDTAATASACRSVDDMVASEPESAEILAVHDILPRMEERDPRLAEVVKLRFFAGLSIEDTAQALGVSDRTVRREWTFAKAWLAETLLKKES